MTQALIIDAVRTPIGRYGGALKDVRPDDLLALVLRSLVERTKIPPEEIEDVLVGCTNQAGEDNRNVARMALLLADYPVSVGGATVNRLCGSGMEATRIAAHAIMCGEGEVFVSGGVESMTRAPFVMGKPEAAFPRGEIKMYDSTIGWRFVNPRLAQKYPTFSMGETAENVAEQEKVAREVQDAFTQESQAKAARAIKEGRFADEIVPVEVPGPKGGTTRFEVDEHPRADTSLDKLAKLKAAFRHGGTVTAGNSSGINDGASAVVIMSAAKAQELGVTPLAVIRGVGYGGCEPSLMGISPVPAVRDLERRSGLHLQDFELLEVHEAFASQYLACERDLGLDREITNVNGSGIGLGHPVGSTGCRLIVTLLHAMRRRGKTLGLATLCGGGGVSMATALELV
jgi:acetyl-CoA acetyltransferase family protein